MIEDADEIRDLLGRTVAGDEQAMNALWERYRLRLERLVRLRMDRRIQGRVDASDILQEVYIEFVDRAEAYLANPPMSFFLWLRFLTTQRLQLVHRYHLGVKMRSADREVSLHRGAIPDATSLSLAAQLIGRFTSVIHAAQRAEMQLILQQAINELEPIDREILAMRHFEELSNSETAEVLCIDPSAASNRHVRALKRLRRSLSGKPGFFNHAARDEVD